MYTYLSSGSSNIISKLLLDKSLFIMSISSGYIFVINVCLFYVNLQEVLVLYVCMDTHWRT